MSLFPYKDTSIPSFFYVCLLNSYFIFKYKREFINSTSAFQINDARQIPIIIPTIEQINKFNQIYVEALSIKNAQLKDKEEVQKFKTLQAKLDSMVIELYKII